MCREEDWSSGRHIVGPDEQLDLLVRQANHPSPQSAPPREGLALLLLTFQNANHSCLSCWYFPFL